MATPESIERGGSFQISSWSIRNPIPTVVFFLVMTIAGIMGFQSLRVNNWPDIDFPIVVVTVIRSGAAPEELQNQVTRIVEDSVAGLSGVRHTQSSVNEGASTTVITFQLDTDLEKDTNDVRNAVAGIRGNLPNDIQDPIVSRVENAQGQALLSYIIRADNMDPEQLSWYVDNDIAKKVHAVKGVSSINRDGGVDREIRVELDPGKLAALGVTAADISSQLRSFNVNMPGGTFNTGDSQQNIRTMGNADSVAALADKRITLSNGTSVRLGDVATVTDTWSRPTARARFNGNEVVGFSVERTRGTSEVRVAGAVRKVIAQLKKDNPHIQIEQVASSVDDVQRSYDSSMESLVIGALLAVAVVFLFLRDWRATLISAVAMPMSLLPTFFVMAALNQSLNVVTLLALSLTIGILVDDAIVEIENIVRHMREGKKPYPAAIEAADEIGLAVVATTATLIAVFAPTGFMPGIVGQFFKSFAIASCVSVFFSLVVARTLTPLMGAYLLRDQDGHHDDKPFWMDSYQKLLQWCLEGHLKWRGFIFFHGVVLACVFFAMAAKQDSVAHAMPQLILMAVALGGAIALGLIFSKNYVKVRWLLLEIGILLFAGLLAPAWGMIMGGLFKMGKLHLPAAAAAKLQAQMAVQEAAATAHGGHAMAAQAMMTTGLVFAVIALAVLLLFIFMTSRFKTSFLSARWAVIIFGVSFFIGSIALMMTIPQESIPASDNSMAVMSLSLPPGATLEETDAVVKRVERDLHTHSEVVSDYASESVGSASIIANLKPKKERKLSQAEFEQEFSKTLKTYPGVRASFGQQGGGGTGVAYLLASDNGDLLNQTSAELQREMASLPELANVQSADNLTQPEIQITPKADQAALMGVSTMSISSAARVATVGDIDQVLAKFNQGDRQIPIRVLLPYSAREDISNLTNLQVPTKYGTSVPLSAVADISYGAGPIQINRIDRTRVATVSADLNGVPQGTADAAVARLPIMQKIDKGEIPGVHTIVNPNTEDFNEMIPNFIIAIATGIGLMYVVLVLLFGSFSHPFTVLMALPVSYGGAFVGLIMMHMSISMPSLIGLIMLTGIAAKNSILLVEYAMVAMKSGMSRFDALMQAARKRARPIVMTTVAMGAGMIPVAVGNDSFRQPMAIAVIGGLITSTLLSLLFIPVMYTIVDQISNFFGKMIAPAFHAQGKEEPAE
jgi:multidrug efflux pump subunit AcrB